MGYNYNQAPPKSIQISPYKRSYVSVVGHLQPLIILVFVFDVNNDGRITGLEQHQVHQESRDATVAVVERVDEDELR